VTAAHARVEQLRQLGRLDDAERVAREALATDPEDPALLASLAAVLYGAGRYAEGLSAAEAAVAAAPQAEATHRLRALLLSALDRHPEAVEAAYRSVTLAPEDPQAATAYARVLRRAGRLADAEQVAHRVVALDPQSAAAHFLLADIAGDRGDRRTARRAYEETLRLDPQHAVARHDLAVLDAQSRRPAPALRGFVEAGTLDPGLPHVLQAVAVVLWQLSWRLRMLLALATLVLVAATGPDPTATGWRARIVAAVSLAVMGLLTWWSTRDLPRQTWPVARAALRTDRPLAFTYAAVAACLLQIVIVLITGFGILAAVVWLVLGLLGALALCVRVVRRFRAR
jgi:tetratricopeptide (TPR) repeat protein